MSQISNRQTDPERGDYIQAVTGIFAIGTPCLRGFTPLKVDDHDPLEQPRSASNQPLWSEQGESNFGDSSGPIFSMYSKLAGEEDDEMVERWQKDADGILIFTGLFSAAVAALLGISVPDLRPNSQDTSAFYLGNIYQILAAPNATVPPTSTPSPAATPPPFSPPTYAVWVNSLWFLSLVIGLTCALLATSLQQWARRYAKVTQPARCSPEKRARMRAFFAGGVDKMHLPWAVEGLPVLIHLSVFFFFVGLVIFLLNVNNSVYLTVIWWLGLFAMLYGCITFMPLFRPDSPYFTPLSTPASFVAAFVLVAILACIFVLYSCAAIAVALCSRLRTFFTPVLITIFSCAGLGSRHRLGDWLDDKKDWFLPFRRRIRRAYSHAVDALTNGAIQVTNLERAAEEIISNRSSEIDLGILNWTIGALGEDDTLEKFFDAITGFFCSPMVTDLKNLPADMFRSKFVASWGGFLARNLLSNSVSDDIRTRRLVLCMNVIKDICDHNGLSDILCHLSSLRFDHVPPSIQAAQILSPWYTSGDPNTSELARYTVAKMLPYVRERDDRWVTFAEDLFGLPEHVLRGHIAHGDSSILLAIFNHAARQVIRTEPWKWEMLPSISKFDILNTLPGLQNEFCAVWNEIVRKARDKTDPHVQILHGIRHMYIALHHGTDAAPTDFDATTPSDTVLDDPHSYPLCDMASHHTYSTVPPCIKLGDPHNISHRISCSESQITPDCGPAAQQTNEANVIPGPTVSPLSRQSTTDVTATTVRSDAPTFELPINETGQTSWVSENTFLSFSLPAPVSVTANPFPVTAPCLPSLSVQQPSDVSDTLPPITSTLTHSHTLDNGEQQGTAALHPVPDTTQTLYATNQIPSSVSKIGSIPHTSEKLNGFPPAVSSPLLDSPPTVTPAIHSVVTPIEPSSSVESALVYPDHISHPLEFLHPSLETGRSDISPQITSVLDAPVSTSSSVLSTQDNTCSTAHSVPMEVSRPEKESVSLNPAIPEHP